MLILPERQDFIKVQPLRAERLEHFCTVSCATLAYGYENITLRVKIFTINDYRIFYQKLIATAFKP
jgi:hypothetical protein